MKSKLSKVLFCMLSVCLISACAEFKDMGKTIGHGTKDVARSIGHASRDAAKSIETNTKKVASDIQNESE